MVTPPLRRFAHLVLFAVLCLAFVSPAPQVSSAAEKTASALAIPFSQTAVQIDGKCSEYTGAAQESFADGGAATGSVFLQFDREYLYVCLQGAQGSLKDRFGSLYLDPQGDGSSYEFAAKDDYALRVNIPGTTMQSFNGSNVANGYVANAVIPPFWNGTSTSEKSDVVEYRLSLKNFGLVPCGKLFGIAAYHHRFAATGDDYGWPSNRYFDQPRTWRLAQLDTGSCTAQTRGTIAYVYRGNAADASSFYNLLTGAGYTVTLVPLGTVTTTDFTAFQLTIIANDSGDLNTWGIPSLTAAQVAKITAANRPILGLGEGGYAFFGKLPSFIGWPNGWHGPSDRVTRPATATGSFYTTPNAIAGDPVPLYTAPVNEVGIYLGGGGVPSDVVVLGLETPNPDHAPLITQGCRQLWGFSGNPLAMTTTGQNLFINAVEYSRTFQCATPQPPPTQCLITKIASPPAGTAVAPGDVITYTIRYTNCKQETVKLVDTIPTGTIYVPGSASDGIPLGSDGALVWAIPASENSTKTFKVKVDKRACEAQTVSNKATLLFAGGTVALSSALVTHPVTCPPIRFPNNEPTYAEDEIQITPYPLILGKPSEISVRIRNASATPQVATVEFQTSPDKFGIGLTFNTFDSKVITLPGNGNAIVKGMFVPAASGHYCIQIKITIPGNPPTVITTSRNLDVTEDLKAGRPDTLTFKVGNPTVTTANINLVVNNTCPGWVATVAPATLTGMAPGEVRDATLTVTPPNPITLGTGCHIDVQGWIGDNLIGGIRKLDVPPVQLPHNVDPPWLEPEISFVPNPPIVGQLGQICVELQNPLAVARTVTVDFAVADFGAGVPFTTVASKPFTLPPNSIARYCADWTPGASGTLHRCALITLRQAGYIAQTSQRNVDLRRALPSSIGSIDVPVLVVNPDPVPHNLAFNPIVFGIDPYWKPVIVTDKGDPPPITIAAGQALNLRLRLVPAVVGSASRAAPERYSYGDASRIDVSVLFDEAVISGFTVTVDTPKVYLPLTQQ